MPSIDPFEQFRLLHCSTVLLRAPLTGVSGGSFKRGTFQDKKFHFQL